MCFTVSKYNEKKTGDHRDRTGELKNAQRLMYFDMSNAVASRSRTLRQNCADTVLVMVG